LPDVTASGEHVVNVWQLSAAVIFVSNLTGAYK